MFLLLQLCQIKFFSWRILTQLESLSHYFSQQLFHNNVGNAGW